MVAALKEKGIIGTQSQLSPKTIKAMDALIFKHNAEHHRENTNKLTRGKYRYVIIAHCLVWHEQQQREYSERVEIEIKMNLKKI